MPTMATPDSGVFAAGHRRNKSSSVLKSIIAPKSHKRTPSDGLALKKNPSANPPYMPASTMQAPLLPPDHPHSAIRAATRTENVPLNPPSLQKGPDASSSPKKSLHKKTLSSVSLRSLAKKEDKDTGMGVGKKSTDTRRPRPEDITGDKPKKTKSSTNLAAMFGKGRSRSRSPVKQQPRDGEGDQENTTPPSSANANAHAPPRTPIWAEFSSDTPQQDAATTTSKVPLNDQRGSLEEEIAMYTPQQYSPSKQRNFFDYGQPSLQKQKRPATKERPKSLVEPKSTSTTSLLETFSRKKTNDRVPLSDTKGNEGRIKESTSSKSIPPRPTMGRAGTDTSRKNEPARSATEPVTAAKKPNRVMAAVAAFNGKSRQMEAPTSPVKLDPRTVDAEFEVVLVCTTMQTDEHSTDLSRNHETFLPTSAPRCEH
jgi:hypothetical protein